MTYTVIIVESPAKCHKIETYLGAGYKCIASYGHIRELTGLDAIDVKNDFTPTFQKIDSKKTQISNIKKLINGANGVLLATDDDREGESIAWHICQVFDLPIKTTKRIIFHEITETAIKKAVQEPTLLNMNIVYAQQARQILDLIVGYRVTPILWDKISHKTKAGLSAGRCQTPALRLIYDNQKDIDSSPGTIIYNTTGYFTSKNIGFTLDFNYADAKSVSAFLKETVGFNHIYNGGDIRKTIHQAPTPLTTSGIQQLASNEMRISPKDTMKSCQKLYEGGYITYMRTDSTTYCADFIEDITKFIGKSYGDEYISETISALSEQSKEAHEAIRPTNINCDIDGVANKELGLREIKLYKLIRKITLESCMKPASYNAITAEITAPENHVYKYSTEQVVFAGFQIVNGFEKDNAVFNYLQTIKKGSTINYKKIASKIHIKDLKSHYTEARLVKLLERNGIGRPSTFSSLVDKIQERGYVKCDTIKGKPMECLDFELADAKISEIKTQREFGGENKKLIIQPLGVLVIELLIKHFDLLFDYTYTKEMEDTLDVIAKGDKLWHELCRECYTEIDRLSVGLKHSMKEVIQIDDNHLYIIAKYGPTIKRTIGTKTDFIPVKSDLNIDKLKRGEYKLEDILATEKQSNERKIGLYQDKMVIIKKGKFGLYVEHGDVKKSLSSYDGATDDLLSEQNDNGVSLQKLVNFMYSDTPSFIIRKIDDNISIRTGKHGDYIYYKKPKSVKPIFLKLTEFIKIHGENAHKTCDLSVITKWIYDTYNV